MSGKPERGKNAKNLDATAGGASKEATSSPTLANPEQPAKGKRKRLSKAFPRPLDKKIGPLGLVRDSFVFPEIEHAHLMDLKHRLVAEGVDIKKSELVRAGLVLLASLDDDEMKRLLALVPRVG